MSDGAVDLKAEARARAYAMPLDEINLADGELFRSDTLWPYFERLRKEDPVHYHKEGLHEDGPYWSVTKFNDIMAVDTNHEVFSSEPSITIFDQKDDFTMPMFIAMDPPKHDIQRKTVSPVVAPHNLQILGPLIRVAVDVAGERILADVLNAEGAVFDAGTEVELRFSAEDVRVLLE